MPLIVFGGRPWIWTFHRPPGCSPRLQGLCQLSAGCTLGSRRGRRHPSRGGDAFSVQGDVSLEEDVVALFEKAGNTFGRVTALVNNAATLERQMRLDAMDAARLHRMFATNAIGTMLCAREAVRRMSTRHGGPGGSIVNVSSGAARSGSPGEYVDYAATKGLSRVLPSGLPARWLKKAFALTASARFHLHGTARQRCVRRQVEFTRYCKTSRLPSVIPCGAARRS